MRFFLFFLFPVLVFSQVQKENIQFLSESYSLEGTLVIPETPTTKKPLIIFVHGSGPNDRNQTAPMFGGNANCLYPNLVGDTIRNFKDIAEYLSDNGYATFRFDKRTFTHGATLDQTTVSPYDFIKDVESAIDFLKLRTDIDANCISLLGHSQGGTLIPYIAAKRTDIKSLISLASPSTSVDTLLSQQIEFIYNECADSATGYNLSQQSLAVFTQVRNGTWPANQPFNGAYPKFWKDWINLSDSVIYYTNQANIPNYFSFGADDFNVPSTDQNKFQTNLTNSFEINTFTNMNHYLTSSTSPLVKNELLVSLKNWLEINKCETYVGISNLEYQNFNLETHQNYYVLNLFKKGVNEILILNNLGQNVFSYKGEQKRIIIEKSTIPNGLLFLKINDHSKDIKLINI